MTILNASRKAQTETASEHCVSTFAMQNEVCQRLLLWHPDEPGCSYPFSLRLHHENGWTCDYTQKAIEEYRKFLFLSQVADHVVCPSEDVDQVWHQHLTYTRSYWEELCGRILRRPLHHQPTRGVQRATASVRIEYCLSSLLLNFGPESSRFLSPSLIVDW